MAAPLSDELQHLQRVVRDFVRETIEPRAAEIERTGIVPDDVRAQALAIGLSGLSIPEVYGGIGTSELVTTVALEALSHGPGGPTFLLGPNAVSVALLAGGTDEQKQRYLPEIAQGKIASFCLTEEGAGSDSAAIRSKAIPDGDHWIITGSKLYITRAQHAELFLVSTVTGTNGGQSEITLFLAEKSQGVRIGGLDAQLGLTGSGSAEVIFDGVRVPDFQRVGELGQGMEILKKVLARARLWAAVRALGSSGRCLELGLEHTAVRFQFGKSLDSFQAVKLKLADLAAKLAASKLLVYHAAETLDAGHDGVQEASMAKLVASENASEIADAVVQLHGAMGVSRDHIVERFYRDVRAYRILDGTSDIQRLIISKRLRQSGVGSALIPGGTR